MFKIGLTLKFLGCFLLATIVFVLARFTTAEAKEPNRQEAEPIRVVTKMVIVGNLIWLTKRKSNPDFPKNYWSEVWEGLWWSPVTMTTVGNDDKKIKGKLGRILAMIWMFSGIFLIANFTASVAAEITVAELQTSINSEEELAGKKVATVAETTSAEYLADQRISYISVETIEDAFAAIEDGEIDAIVYDSPVLQSKVYG